MEHYIWCGTFVERRWYSDFVSSGHFWSCHDAYTIIWWHIKTSDEVPRIVRLVSSGRFASTQPDDKTAVGSYGRSTQILLSTDGAAIEITQSMVCNEPILHKSRKDSQIFLTISTGELQWLLLKFTGLCFTCVRAGTTIYYCFSITFTTLLLCR